MKRDFLKMLLIAILPICAVSCIDNVPEEEVLPRDAVSFDYYIDQQTEPQYYLDFYVDSDVTFINTSPQTTSGTPTWDFGDGVVLTGDTAVHSFAKAGTYTVQLTIGDFTKKQVLMIAPMVKRRRLSSSKTILILCFIRISSYTFPCIWGRASLFPASGQPFRRH